MIVKFNLSKFSNICQALLHLNHQKPIMILQFGIVTAWLGWLRQLGQFAAAAAPRKVAGGGRGRLNLLSAHAQSGPGPAFPGPQRCDTLSDSLIGGQTL